MTVPLNLRAEARRLKERVRELEAYSDTRRLDATSLRFGNSRRELTREVKEGHPWPQWVRPAWFEAEFDIPQDWPKDAELWADLGGEGCWIEGEEARFGFNPMHRRCAVSLAPGERCRFTFEVVPHGYQGAPVHEPKVAICRLAVPNPDVRAFTRDLEVATDVIDFLAQREDREVGVRLVKLVDDALRELRLPRSPSEAYLARMAWLEATEVEGGSTDSPALQVRSALWERPTFEATPLELGEEDLQRVRQTMERFRQASQNLAAKYPGRGRLVLIGHAHLDVAWLWPISETRKKSRRTFATACALAERYENYVFGQSQAYLYAAVEEDDPALFARIQSLVKAGRFEVLGGSWVEPDGNLASGESTVRQLLYGQRYFESRFGRRCSVAWLPDTFGYAGNLPQLYASAGMHRFMTTKLGWNETNKFPHDLYWWEGLDGTRVLAHTFKEIGPGPDPALMHAAWAGYVGKERAEVALQTYGRGDGGGGPSEEMIEGFVRLGRQPALPQLDLGTAESVFDELTECEDLPVWRGEKYLEKHRGTFTSQVVVKRDVQRLGERLRALEVLCSLAWCDHEQPYPQEQLEHLWKELLVHEFHDILPGSSIHTVNQEAAQRLHAALESASVLLDSAFDVLQKPVPDTWTVWNLGEAPVLLAGVLAAADPETKRVTLASGANLRCQRIGDRLAFVGEGELAPGAALTLRASNDEHAFEGGVEATTSSLRSNLLDVRFSASGSIDSLRSLASGKEFVREGAGRLVLHEDVPREYEAWDIDPIDLAHFEELAPVGEPKVLYQGPVEAALQFRLEAAGVEIALTYRLRWGSTRLQVEATVQWHCRRNMLRLHVPTTVHADTARFDTLFGSVTRPTHPNTSWDAAKYEVPAHRGVTLEDASHGIQLIAPYGRHGFSVTGAQIGLSLLRAPIHPDPLADEGEHHFEYAIAVFDEGHVPAPVRQQLEARPGALPAGRSEGVAWMCHEGVRCAAVKKAEERDAVIVRLYEAEGVARSVDVSLPAWARRVTLCSILEEPEAKLKMEQGDNGKRAVRVDFAPYAVRTLSFERST